MKKTISILLTLIFILTNTISYSSPNHLASQSLFRRIEEQADQGRRTFLRFLALIIPATILHPGCVFDTSGLALPDGGTPTDGGIVLDDGNTTDGGIHPTDKIEQSIDAIMDSGNDPVTILQTSTYNSENTIQRLSPLAQFVRDNNASFKYHGANWQWTLSNTDRQNILDNGLTYIFNGHGHQLRLIGKDTNDQERTIIFKPQIPAVPDYTQPYRITITSEQIHELAQQIGLELNTINIYFENLETEEDFILNGLQKQYAVLAAAGEVTSDRISPDWRSFANGGATIAAVPTLQGININFVITAGDNGQSAGVNIPTRTSGINTADPNLEGAWKMDDDNLGLDSGPNGNTLTNVDSVESVPGRIGNSISLSGSNYLTIDSPIGLQGGAPEQTISAWVKTEALTGSIAGRWSPSDGYLLHLTAGRVIYSYGHGTYDNITSDETINDGLWHHVTAVANGSEVKLYIDGREVKSAVQETEVDLADPLTPFMIGQNANYDWPFTGFIDEVAVFNRALASEEIRDIAQVDSSNFLAPALTTLDLKARGNSPFILRLTDNTGQILDMFILGLDPSNWESLAINIIEVQAVMNPSFNLENITSIKILVEDTFLPIGGNIIEIDGLIGIPPITRHRYATDWHDIDITREDYKYLTDSLRSAKPKHLKTNNRIPVYEIAEWQDILLPNGLGFTVHGRIYSAFTGTDGKIYIPSLNIAKNNLKIAEGYIKDRILKVTERRNSIILGHEIDEKGNPDHGEAVFNEFSRNSINGLNYADVVTILLETLSSNNITAIDINFHRQFIANLLMQGMFLDKEGSTYLKIIREIVDDRIDENSLRKLYTDILSEIKGLVSSYKFTHRRLSKEEITVPDRLLEEEPGFKELFSVIRETAQSGIIYIDLAKFLVKNTSLADENEVVTINMEYLKRFAVFLHKLQDKNIKIIGVHSRINERVIEELTSIIREDFGLSRDQFPIHTVDFTAYSEFIRDSRNAVSILTESSWQNIPDRTKLKIIDSFMDNYNRVNSSGWEFYTALKGLEYDMPQNFLLFIMDNILQQFVNQKIITEEERDMLKGEIEKKGIAFIPAYFDPIQYYKTIESQKALLISA